MSEYAELCRDMRDHKREIKDKFGVLCEGCKIKMPKAHPTIMLPRKKCKVCGHKDTRPRSIMEQK